MFPRLMRWTRQRLSGVFDGGGVMPGVIPEGYDELIEGCARAVYRKGEVFYNPVQVVNRDLSVQVLRHFSNSRGESAEPLRILEGLSATGLRSLRYYLEVPNVGTVLANDADATAVSTILANVQYNGLDPCKSVIPHQGDAISVLTDSRDRSKQFDVVDLDPYGSSAPFLDAAVQAVSDHGILAVTCTDLPVLCGNSPEICFGRYGATPLKGATGHEMAVRIVLAAIHAAANRHGRAVEPIVCAKIDFYVRLFVRVRNSRVLAQQTPSKLAMVYQCAHCSTQHFQPLGRIREATTSNASRRKRRRAATSEVCEVSDMQATPKQSPNLFKKYSPAPAVTCISSVCSICEGPVVVGGPIWTGSLVDVESAWSMLEDLEKGEGEFRARTRVQALLRLLIEEVIGAPLFMHLPSMCKVLRVSPPPAAAIRRVLTDKGYKVSQSHTDPLAIKTDAPAELIWDVLRLWVRKVGNPFAGERANGGVKEKGDVNNVEDRDNGQKDNRPPGARVMDKIPNLVIPEEVDFSVKKDKFVRGSGGTPGLPRYLPNPEPFWGPKARAGKRRRVENNPTSDEGFAKRIPGDQSFEPPKKKFIDKSHELH